ncbi:PTS sugar transporter subunit IIB [Tissierella sp. MSJ-40]|uniref:PTS sugar transporter subunit IIB n=1 Tax=Tissierella simiarum TaxID=2841534 RepID=A0ABS6E853_9FIRM|nr:PTS sugar transporter subunit IIB [Tissierella simiarum]MBU5439100.1 PTS sugar transporter subunit IIB [Tissierella simiarum]
MAKILVACGTGICTSTMAVDRLKKELNARGKGNNITIVQCKVAEIPSKVNDVDLIVCTTQVSGNISKPVVSGLPFLTGVGVDKVIDEVIEKLGL